VTIKTYTFPNGFRLVYEKSKNIIPISSVNVFCDVGSINEPQYIRGASHMIEHMCFKGTKTRKSPKEIFIEYDKIGAYFNAFTTKRYTAYVFKCSNDHLDSCITILADMILNSTFLQKEYHKEHDVVTEENLDNENDPDDQIYMYSDKMLYSGSSFENAVDDIHYHKKGSLSRDQVFEFYKNYYVPNNMIFSIVTDMSFETVIQFIEKTYFAKHKSGVIGKQNIIHELRPQTDIQYNLIKKKGVENILLTIGFRVCSIHNTDRWALDILQNILSGTMSGRIFMKLREKTGLIYSSDIETNYYDKTGDFTIFTQTDKDLIFKGSRGVGPGLLPSFVNLFNDLVKNGVDKRELEITKGYIKGNMLIEMEDINTPCEYNGNEFLLAKEKIVPFLEIYKECYENITCEDINNVIKKYIRRELMSVCILGENLPQERFVKKEFDKFLR
jgi:predicted Zn-dependent peptidase